MEKHIENAIGIAKEQLEDILDALHMEHDITCKYIEYDPKDANFYGLTHFTAKINKLPYRTVVIRYRPIAETEEQYVNRVKAYLLDVLDAAVNL